VERTGWYIQCYSRKVPESTDFLSLFEISDADRLFIENKIREYRCRLFLLKSGKRSMLISTHLYFSSGFLLSFAINEPVEALCQIIELEHIYDTEKAPSCESVSELKRLSGEYRERLIRTLDSIAFLVSGHKFLPEADAYPLYLSIAEKAKLVEAFSEASFEIANGGVFGNVNNYDMMFCTAFLFCATAYIKRVAPERTGKLIFSSSCGKLYVTLEAEVLPDTRAFEFDILKLCADQLELGFFIIEEKGKVYAHLCAHRPDYAKIGLKGDIYLK